MNPSSLGREPPEARWLTFEEAVSAGVSWMGLRCRQPGQGGGLPEGSCLGKPSEGACALPGVVDVR